MDSPKVTMQPTNVYSYTETEKTKKSSHKCGCERCLFGDDDKKECPKGIVEWCDFRIYVSGSSDDGCGTCTVLCFPINFTMKLLCCFPCATYNSLRNLCKGTKDKNYIC